MAQPQSASLFLLNSPQKHAEPVRFASRPSRTPALPDPSPPRLEPAGRTLASLPSGPRLSRPSRLLPVSPLHSLRAPSSRVRGVQSKVGRSWMGEQPSPRQFVREESQAVGRVCVALCSLSDASSLCIGVRGGRGQRPTRRPPSPSSLQSLSARSQGCWLVLVLLIDSHNGLA